jgi:hypothetical protein
MRLTIRPIPSWIFAKRRGAFHLLPGGEGRDEGARKALVSDSSLTVLGKMAIEDFKWLRKWFSGSCHPDKLRRKQKMAVATRKIGVATQIMMVAT